MKYQCQACGDKLEYIAPSKQFRESLPPNWHTITISGSPIVSRTVCGPCTASLEDRFIDAVPVV